MRDKEGGHEVNMQDDGKGQGVEEHHDQQQGLHIGGGELTGSLVEGDQHHQRGGAHAVFDQAGDEENHDEVNHVGEEDRGDHHDGPGGGG